MEKDRVGINRVTYPAGEYWVGDPCYVVLDEHWGDWLDATGWTSPIMQAQIDLLPGYTFNVCGVNTAWGDGGFDDQFGFGYCVDSGMIGVVPERYRYFMEHYRSSKAYELDHLKTLSQLVNFAEPFDIYRKGGVIHIGHLAIDTDPVWDEDE